MPNKPSMLQLIVSNSYPVWYILGMDLHNPHDTFFTAYFGNPTMLLHLLHFTLPKEVFALLDTDSLTIGKGTYIEKNFSKHYSDIDVSVTLQGTAAKIYILVEHKSYYDSKTLLQMLRYITQIWAKDAKKEPAAPLTPIIPVLFYHGERKETESRFIDLFPPDFPKEIKPYQPDFAVNLFNLTSLQDDMIEGPPEFTAARDEIRQGPNRESAAGPRKTRENNG